MSSAGVEKRGSASTVKACDLCRKRKRRCIWTSGEAGCTPCVNLNETCTTTHVRKPRSKPQKGNRIAEYESRIKQLESLLQKRSAEQPQMGQQPLQQSIRPAVSPSTLVENLRHEVQTMPHPGSPGFDPYDSDPLGEMTSILPPELIASLQLHEVDQDDSPSEPYISATSQERQASADFQADAAFLQSAAFDANKPAPTSSTLPSPTSPDWYLPPPELATSLLAEFLNDFNTAIPLYQPDVLVNYLRTCYAGVPEDRTVAWTSTYIVFGMAHTLRAMSPAGTTQDNAMAKYYLAKIYVSLPPLLCAPASLGVVQCLLGVAILITHLPCKYNMNEGHFIGTALRVIQGLTYNPDKRADPIPDYTSITQQQRRVFWLAFIGDTMTSIITNSPTTYRHEDVVECSPEAIDFLLDPVGAVTAAEGHWKVNIFRLRVRLAILQAEANDQIFALRLRNMTSMDVEVASTIVLARLEEFHNHELFKLDIDSIFQLLYRSDVCHVVHLEAAYFSTVYRLHAFVAYEKATRINPFSLEGLQATSEMRQHKSFEAAHRLLSLLPIAPRGDVGLYWHSHVEIIAALVTVLAHHINNPTEKLPTPKEVQVYSQFLIDLGTMVHNSGNLELLQLRDFGMSLFSKLQQMLRVQPFWGLVQHHSIGPSPNTSLPSV
ncbi:hypothetical protein T440DRAFT_38175 [Plenodomus tracheiphilus IPT5]|uniref:Zn(2)-C6 fungal-type domain-containing protein n=1 Tax=Plenodomus tracheiphilus IPT5 TaxID=1408161 RepID=A0A6A7BA37_9PLEO|nr:hypothetical protein T440DRAFT_38175 [Plenodomus tracheiphilus IPT5]